MSPEPASASQHDARKTKMELLAELRELREQLAFLKDTRSKNNVAEEALREDEAECRRMEQALLESKERFDYALRAAREGIWDWNMETDEVYYSPRYKEILGYSDEEIEPHTSAWMRLMHPDDRERAMKVVDSVMHGEREYEMEFRMRHKDGHYVDILSRGYPIRREPNGPITRIVGTHMDITERNRMAEELHRARDELEQRVRIRTAELQRSNDELNIRVAERKQAEEKLRESEERFRTLADNIPNLAWMADVGGWIFWYNKQWYDYTGTTPEEMRGWGWQKVHHPDYVKAVTEEWSASIRSGKPYDNVFPLRGRDGEYRWFLTRVTPIKDEHGNIQRWFGTNTDITERKQMEDSLKLSSFSMDRARDMIFWMRPDGSFEYVNESACKGYGYSREELLKLTIFDLNPGYTKEAWRARWQALRNTGSFVYKTENKAKNGRLFPIEVSATRIVHGGKELMFAFARDITEHVQAEERITETMQRAELYLDLMGHDINNFNQATMGFLELARDAAEEKGKLDAGSVEMLDKAIESLSSSSQLISNVRKLQRERRGQYELKIMELGEILEEVCKQFQDVPGRSVEVNCGAVMGMKVRANDLLNDVFINLIGNAIKHSMGSLFVNVRMNYAWVDGAKYYEVIVEDNGPGIPDGAKKMLLSRLDPTETRARGKGLGLYLIKTLVDDFHGHFRVEDRVKGDHSKGARFVVLLPAVEG